MASLVRLVAITAAAFVAASFVLFAAVELQDSSEGQVQKLNNTVAPKASRPTFSAPIPSPR